jgi:hypothetical protein
MQTQTKPQPIQALARLQNALRRYGYALPELSLTPAAAARLMTTALGPLYLRELRRGAVEVPHGTALVLDFAPNLLSHDPLALTAPLRRWSDREVVVGDWSPTWMLYTLDQINR